MICSFSFWLLLQLHLCYKESDSILAARLRDQEYTELPTVLWNSPTINSYSNFHNIAGNQNVCSFLSSRSLRFRILKEHQTIKHIMNVWSWVYSIAKHAIRAVLANQPSSVSVEQIQQNHSDREKQHFRVNLGVFRVKYLANGTPSDDGGPLFRRKFCRLFRSKGHPKMSFVKLFTSGK